MKTNADRKSMLCMTVAIGSTRRMGMMRRASVVPRRAC
ncbi:hypothetical protein CJF31_00007760 [Rutstroemia sp. NJR-2017a BVV2]|nr:hypothetical protein CJF31_00005340 [Rutstroemia sp. NJR-2017a BVV2]PQE21897.1 hypothetical protein CJF31_00007760 [Rutstroemia sp. NJR-2017a BVV2]